MLSSRCGVIMKSPLYLGAAFHHVLLAVSSPGRQTGVEPHLFEIESVMRHVTVISKRCFSLNN